MFSAPYAFVNAVKPASKAQADSFTSCRGCSRSVISLPAIEKQNNLSKSLQIKGQKDPFKISFMIQRHEERFTCNL